MNPECISRRRREEGFENNELYQDKRPTGWRTLPPRLSLLALLASLVSPVRAFGEAKEAVGFEAGPYPLWVQMCDATGFDRATLADVEREVSSIYLQAGIEIQWVEQCGGEGIELAHPGAARVYVLDQIPKSLLGHFHHLRKNSSRMGIIPANPGSKPEPGIFVSRRSVEEHASNFDSMPPVGFQLSRALGRVVSHELAHRFLGQTRHTPSGILRAGFDRCTLTEARPTTIGFTKKQAQRLRQLARLGISETKLGLPPNPEREADNLSRISHPRPHEH